MFRNFHTALEINKLIMKNIIEIRNLGDAFVFSFFFWSSRIAKLIGKSCVNIQF